VLVTPQNVETTELAARLSDAFGAGDVASLIVPQYQMDEDQYQALLGEAVAIGHNYDAAVVAAGDTRIAGRCDVDGIHVIGGHTEVRSALKEFGHKWIIGSGGAESRHAALTMGEEDPDYVLFGRFGQDTHAEPHKRNIALGDWWSKVIQVPCIVMGGNEVSSVTAAAETGADFVALSLAVLGDGADPNIACAQANSILENFVFSDEAA
jgi:thiamine-phosphate pyrophosphorylase